MFYPGTGAACEAGVGEGKGFTVNIPWNGSACDADYITAFSQVRDTAPSGRWLGL